MPVPKAHPGSKRITTSFSLSSYSNQSGTMIILSVTFVISHFSFHFLDQSSFGLLDITNSQLPNSSSEKPRDFNKSRSSFKISDKLSGSNVKKTFKVPSVVEIISKSL